ncbi:DNA-binding protein [Xaviernesmea oryzae]|uniref:DNA-binding protein n=1 Tax=Xaviernesmea oryzae TaxID=464029 RepID=A0A1Q9B3M8_9HYPH|nr:ParB/RepB/Spo0J family partition protein [Xaviernesmea oryzae]OLP62654.1 DNA-binding protein [Xaviernesmea oryzae]SEM27585.1 chromosome partitioning protein, ParB family [Xaviernesmea oryzae]
MAQANAKITLNATCDIPFNKLVLSQANVRRVKAGVSIEDLAEDIARRGILTSLNVRPELDTEGRETGIYRVPAGGRRYRALDLLVKQKRLSKTAPVPCVISTGVTSEIEDSLAENVHREDLHPLDQFRAFKALAEEGLGIDDIAARFFVSSAVVRQRLRLAAVSPALLDLYAEGEMNLDQVMAFSITEDHARQEQVWEALVRAHSKEAYFIRRLLTETAVRAVDRRAVYVGVEAYEAAGGIVMRDLFEQDNGGWLQDPALLEQLVFEKLKRDAEALKAAEGWMWVEAAIDFPYGHMSGLRRFYGRQHPVTEEERAAHEAIKTEYDQIEADYAASEDYSAETEARLDELGTAIDAFNDRRPVFAPEDIAIGGAFASLSADGTLKIERGFVRPEDQPKTAGDDPGEGEDDEDDVVRSNMTSGEAHGAVGRDQPSGTLQTEEPEEDERLRPLSDRLVEDLTAVRTIALRNALANDPTTAFIAALHVLVLKIFYHAAGESCLELGLQQTFFAQTQGLKETTWAVEIDERQTAWGQDLPQAPRDLWDFLLALDEASQRALFAHCVSLSVNAVAQLWNRRPGAIAHADKLASALGFDMAEQGWVPTVDSYLGRVPKVRILEAVRQAKGEDAAQLIDHLKKGDMAREAERLLAGSGWLPEPLRRPDDDSVEMTKAADPTTEVNDGHTVTDAHLPPSLTEEAVTERASDEDEARQNDGFNERRLEAAE